MMQYFLAKSEPASYSIDQLKADKKTTWDGVKNPQALRAIREMRPGDHVFIYHSGGESEVVGMAKVVSEPRADPKDEKSVTIDLEFLSKLQTPVKLKEIKESHLFDDWALVRQSRLSTMQAPSAFVSWMKKRFPGEKI
jgi:predicted RNA-binding protein with PUA-like domain